MNEDEVFEVKGLLQVENHQMPIKARINPKLRRTEYAEIDREPFEKNARREFRAKKQMESPLQNESQLQDRVTHDKDFRLRLNQLLQETVWAKVDASLINVFKNPSAQRVVADDFNRVWAWTRMFSESVHQSAEDNLPPRRTIKVGIYQLREDGEIFQSTSRMPEFK